MSQQQQQQQPPAPAAAERKAYERTIFSYDPIDEFTATVGDWIFHHTQNQSNVEIEAKIGTIVDKMTDQRLYMPVMTETILNENTDGIRFVSEVTLLFTYTNAKTYEGSKVSYQRIQEVDFYHNLDPRRIPPESVSPEELAHMKGEIGNGRKETKLRVTKDNKTFEPKYDHAIVKRRIASLEVYCPKRCYDYRISINTETPVPLPPPEDKPLYWRDKNRMTYKHELTQVDLTVVRSTDPLKGAEQSHELEIEFRDARELLAAAYESRGGGPLQDWTTFDDMCHIFLNNVRMLIRNMPEL
ncbi:mRNA-capping enzyme subunit beta [Tilletia horrida]|nr:mRNA-capping enzyme subunit beta [Tilletia horrida]